MRAFTALLPLNYLGEVLTVNVIPSRRRGCACRNCGARQMKAKHPDEYVIGPLCRGCGKRGTLRLDQWYDKRSSKRRGHCRCDGLYFPHRRESLGCNYGPQWVFEE